MAYQTVTKNSYGSRLKNALSGVAMGFVLLIAGVVLLFWNEGRTVKTTRMLKAAQKVCVHVDDIQTVNPELNGKTVHMNGFATTDEILSDSYFGIKTNAIKLKVDVEYYQYVENKHEERRDKVGGGEEVITTYTYEKRWVPSLVNSSSFADPDYKNANNRQPILTLEDQQYVAEKVTFGAYTLSSSLKNQISNDAAFDIEPDQTRIDQINAEAKKLYMDTTSDYVHVQNNVIYLGRSTSAPEIGDSRITYTRTMPCDASIIAKVNGDTFEAFTHTNGYSLETLSEGTHSMDEMFASEHSSNKTTAWILRVLGILLLYWGFKNIFGILDTLAKVLPFLSSIVGLGTGLVAGILALALGLTVIAISWIWYRPLLGIVLLAVVVAMIWFFTKKGKEKKAAQAAAEAAAAPEPPAAPAE